MATDQSMQGEDGGPAKGPRIWGRFQGLRPLPNGRVPEFWITDLTEEWDEQVLHHLEESFLSDAPLMRAIRMRDDPVGVQEVLEIWRHMLGLRTSIVALTSGDDGKPVLVASNLLAVKPRKHSDEFQIRSAKLRTILEAMSFMEAAGAAALEQLDPGGTALLAARGMVVLPAFRGQGVALQLLRARVPVCRALGLRLTATVFVGDGVARSAARAGFHLLAELPYTEYRDRDGRAPFLNAGDGACRFMALPVPPLPESQD